MKTVYIPLVINTSSGSAPGLLAVPLRTAERSVKNTYRQASNENTIIAIL
jgi:hypothetical protein